MSHHVILLSSSTVSCELLLNHSMVFFRISTKTPRENGVVSLHGKWKHAISLSKVLLGILAGLSGNNQVNAADIFRKIKVGRKDDNLNNVKVNRLVGVTLGGRVYNYKM